MLYSQLETHRFLEAATVGVFNKVELVTFTIRLSPLDAVFEVKGYLRDRAQPGTLAGQKTVRGVGRIASWCYKR